MLRLELQLIYPQEHRATDDQREADDPDIEQHAPDEVMRQRACDSGGQEGEQHADDEPARRGVAEHLRREPPQAPEVDGQERQERAELDQRHEASPEGRVVEAEEPLRQQQMPARGHRDERRQPCDGAEGDGLEQVEPREGHGGLRGGAGASGWQAIAGKQCGGN